MKFMYCRIVSALILYGIWLSPPHGMYFVLSLIMIGAMLCSCEWWWVKRQDLQCNMCELGKFNIEKYQHVIVFLYLCRVLFFKVP